MSESSKIEQSLLLRIPHGMNSGRPLEISRLDDGQILVRIEDKLQDFSTVEMDSSSSLYCFQPKDNNLFVSSKIGKKLLVKVLEVSGSHSSQKPKVQLMRFREGSHESTSHRVGGSSFAPGERLKPEYLEESDVD
jgi:hypothetical protein